LTFSASGASLSWAADAVLTNASGGAAIGSGGGTTLSLYGTAAQLNAYLAAGKVKASGNGTVSVTLNEQSAGITGGNIMHGELLLHQLFFLRPTPQWADFRTPLDGYYFGAAGAHPGGGVMGAAGKMAATAILEDW
jgi:hypothetical protein